MKAVKQLILLEGRISKDLAVIVNATPDSSHVEQTTLILRYLNLKVDTYEVQERFLMFSDCSNKKGERDCSINNGCFTMAYHSSCRLKG